MIKHEEMRGNEEISWVTRDGMSNENEDKEKKAINYSNSREYDM